MVGHGREWTPQGCLGADAMAASVVRSDRSGGPAGSCLVVP